ncbi:MAG: hypothetical protein ACKPKO_64740, partial [Candidatus Fonsibacter sp.]
VWGRGLLVTGFNPLFATGNRMLDIAAGGHHKERRGSHGWDAIKSSVQWRRASFQSGGQAVHRGEDLFAGQ